MSRDIFKVVTTKRVIVRKRTTTFGDRIRTFRLKAGLTQAELADAVSMERTSIVNVEGGVQLLALPAFVKVCKALKTSPNEMLEWKENISDA